MTITVDMYHEPVVIIIFTAAFYHCSLKSMMIEVYELPLKFKASGGGLRTDDKSVKV